MHAFIERPAIVSHNPTQPMEQIGRPIIHNNAPGAGLRASSWISRAILVITCGDRFSYELMILVGALRWW